VYLARAARHFRIYRAGGGRDQDDLPGPLAEALSQEASRTATQFFRTCARALDYLPPVDVTFGDFLRAVMTAERDFDPLDPEGIRDAWMQAFRRRAILPADAPFFSEEALCWPDCGQDLPVKNLPFGGPLGLSYPERERTARALEGFLKEGDHMARLGLDPAAPYSIPSFHPLYRIDAASAVRWDLMVEVVQTAPTAPGAFPMRGGTTVIMSTGGTGDGGGTDVFVRYAIAKPRHGAIGAVREQRQAAFLDQMGVRRGGSADRLRVNFALVHGEA